MCIRKLSVVVAVTLLTAFPTLTAAQGAMTEEGFAKAMTEINFLVGDAELHIDARYWPDLGEDIRKLRTQFEMVETFWTTRGTTEAAAFAHQAIELLDPIQVASDEKNPQAAQAAVREMRGMCQACHQQFREQTDDGYRIKQ